MGRRTIMTSLSLGHTLRLSPIERPRSLLVRLFNWVFRRQFGKAMMPSRVIYARLPTLLWRTLPLYHLFDRGLSLDAELRHLVEVQVSILNGCSFCADLHRATALRTDMSEDKLDALGAANPSAQLTVRERAALRYVTEIATTGTTDEGFAELAACFSEREIVELTWLQAFTTYLNRLAVPLGIGSDGFCELTRKN
jgi:AhpD family alkylhydroperoxidase